VKKISVSSMDGGRRTEARGCCACLPASMVDAERPVLSSSFSGACAFEQHAGKNDAGSDRGG
jgi:hypothetical protein